MRLFWLFCSEKRRGLDEIDKNKTSSVKGGVIFRVVPQRMEFRRTPIPSVTEGSDTQALVVGLDEHVFVAVAFLKGRG